METKSKSKDICAQISKFEANNKKGIPHRLALTMASNQAGDTPAMPPEMTRFESAPDLVRRVRGETPGIGAALGAVHGAAGETPMSEMIPMPRGKRRRLRRRLGE